jgi:hypothetical protein
MYWIYLIIFTLAVLVPDIIPHESKIFFLGEEQLEEILIFVFGFTGLFLFRWKEKQSNINLREKMEVQKEARQISKDLTNTYSYIGETNRKLEIMKNISIMLSGFPDTDSKKEKEFFDTLVESVYVLSKSEKIVVRFINTKTGKTEKEIKNKRRIFSRANNGEIIRDFLNENKSFTETKSHFVAISPGIMDEMIVAIITSKNNQQQKLEDPEMLKALASQSLVAYCHLKEKTKNLINRNTLL